MIDALLYVDVDELSRTGQEWSRSVGAMFRGSTRWRNFAHTSWHGSSIPPDGADPNWTESAHMTSLEPMLTYSGTQSRALSIDVVIMADGGYEGGYASAPKTADDVRQTALWLEALARPFRGSDGLRYSPPPIRITWGSVFRMRGVMAGVSIRWGGGVVDGDFMRADVSLNIVGAARDFASTAGGDRNQAYG